MLRDSLVMVARSLMPVVMPVVRRRPCHWLTHFAAFVLPARAGLRRREKRTQSQYHYCCKQFHENLHWG